MRYLKKYKEIKESDKYVDEFSYIVKDALVDMIHSGLDVYVERMDFEQSNRVKVIINRARRNILFSFNDIKDSINQLISILSDYDGGFTIVGARYYIKYYTVGYLRVSTSVIKWKNINMDPIGGEVLSNDILKILENEEDISDEKRIATFELIFEEDDSYRDIDESDSWAGSLYAYDKFWKKSNRGEIVELPTKQTTHYKCNDCGIEFRSFTGECVNCKSDNVDELPK